MVIFKNFRPVDEVQGFTRETLIALAADLETRQWRHNYLVAHGIPAEHPRSSTTDDVECFFSILRDTVGKDFTLKQVQYYFLKKVAGVFNCHSITTLMKLILACTYKGPCLCCVRCMSLRFNFFVIGILWVAKGLFRIHEKDGS